MIARLNSELGKAEKIYKDSPCNIRNMKRGGMVNDEFKKWEGAKERKHLLVQRGLHRKGREGTIFGGKKPPNQHT